MKIRVANSYETDFIEVELDNSKKSLSALLDVLCTELQVSRENIVKIRKLPNTIIRKDKDVSRLTDFQEIEVVLGSKVPKESELEQGLQGNSPQSTKFLQYSSSVLY